YRKVPEPGMMSRKLVVFAENAVRAGLASPRVAMSDRICDEVRRGWVFQRPHRTAGPDGLAAHPWPRRGVAARGCTTRRQNAHGTEERELLYPWHPWTGRLVHVHEVIDKAGAKTCRCSLSGLASGRWLEVPAWMFDRAACGKCRTGAVAHVDMTALCLLA